MKYYGVNDYRDYLCHHGILGQKWGVRRYQNKDGSLTDSGKKRYQGGDKEIDRAMLRYGKALINEKYDNIPISKINKKDRNAIYKYLRKNKFAKITDADLIENYDKYNAKLIEEMQNRLQQHMQQQQIQIQNQIQQQQQMQIQNQIQNQIHQQMDNQMHNMLMMPYNHNYF